MLYLLQVIRLRLTDTNPAIAFDEWLPRVTPTFTWHWPHLAFIRRKLEDLRERLIDRLAVFVPPRHGKSEQVTVRWPAWTLEWDPAHRFIVGCHTAGLAKKFSRRTRMICRQRGIEMSHERYAVDDWETAAGGGLRAVGVGNAVAGYGALDLIIDDPVKSRKESNSPAYRQMVWDWYTDDLVTRLEPNGGIVLQMTRWHEDDLAGRIIRSEEGKDWTIIALPAIAEANDPLGRAEGEALCPDRFELAQLERFKRVLRDSFYALYQGRPVAQEGNLLKRGWFRYARVRPGAGDTTMVVQSWDTANKDSEVSNCPNVCHTWVVTRQAYFLVDRYRDWLTFPALKRVCLSKAAQWKVDVVLIEDKGSGQQLIQELRESTRLPVVPVLPRADKVTRFSAETIAYEAGLVYHLEDTEWLADYEAQVTSFPVTEYLDDGDALSQFLAWARRNATRFGFESAGVYNVASEAYGGDVAHAIDEHFAFGRVRGASESYRGF